MIDRIGNPAAVRESGPSEPIIEVTPADIAAYFLYCSASHVSPVTVTSEGNPGICVPGGKGSGTRILIVARSERTPAIVSNDPVRSTLTTGAMPFAPSPAGLAIFQ